jgi:hypothetical protein
MVQDQRRNGIGERDLTNDGGAGSRVYAHLLEFFRCQCSWFREDVFRYRKLADVMQQRGHLHRFYVIRRYSERAGETNRVHLNAPDVIVSRLILGVDGECERLDRGKARVGNVMGAPREAASDADGKQRNRQQPERGVGEQPRCRDRVDGQNDERPSAPKNAR